MDIIQTLKDQRQELDRGLQGLSLVVRNEEKKLQRSSRLIQVVAGVRRCGKSVLIYQALQGKKYGYVNFDDDRLLHVKPNDVLAGLYQIYGKEMNVIFLDEIQNLDQWELFVNRLHRAGFAVFLTGSNAKLLAKEMATHLTGRHRTIELFPFSFREYLEVHNFKGDVETTAGRSELLHYFKEFVSQGGFPEVVMGKEEQISYLRELYQKIIERDIVGRYHVSYVKTLKEIARTVMSNPGRLLSYGKIRRQFGLGSDHTVKNYVSYLTETYLLMSLSKFSFKPVEIEKSEKKLYCIDTGMSRAVGVQSGRDEGHLVENVVAIELFRRQSSSADVEMYYWKNTLQEEVDFVIRERGKITQLIQVCVSLEKEDTKQREIRALLKASKDLRCKNLSIITLDSGGEEEVEWFGIKGKIKYIPIWKWLLE
ncbi:MAG: hypothetical protein A2912_01540 [Candidatus Buchananbacteria bacterium RIFCSPLOWO2_01_FULL_40_23b]|uniref:ATPase n=1 Tax=Candidatus Buchananbacteria bacterium RIFCSPLOWO2_01_FULL_40_23b TaxID=1797544 RepID=A0A1G1YUL7_9BACT|nr:MAG: hypothetical protein A2912_01540 [Candidatus Buchananbacteria bacterium RIFCSPLOWO2_01_FULL_40_23b]